MSNKFKIAILTTARSDFGALKRVIRHACTCFDVDLLVAGSHFLVSRGETIKEIEKEFVDAKNPHIVCFNAMDSTDTAVNQVETVAKTLPMASNWFRANHCDLLLFLGDRWELWGVTLAAFLHGIPLAHISGGEVTEGVIDDSVRHTHTKLSALHFAATSEYARNISLMGEEDWRISVVGECGLDLIHDSEIGTPDELENSFGIDLEKPTLLVTFHPSTLDLKTPVKEQIGALLDGLEAFATHLIIFTAPGVEQGSDIVLTAIHKFVDSHSNSVLVNHFGSRNYLAVMSKVRAVIGNSSSGLVEASSFGIPAVNVGQRQKHRLAADSVLHANYDAKEIRDAIAKVLTHEYQEYAKHCPNPYDPFQDGKNSLRIIKAINQALTNIPREKLLMKKFENMIQMDQWGKLLLEVT